jgi:hypothetical protein
MKMQLTIAGSVILLAVATAGGYWLGFRDAWSMGMRADAAPRGAVSIAQLHLIERGRLNEVKFALESDVDSGLVQWHDLSGSRLRPFVNVLSGTEVFPEYEAYVRALATYRKANKSPLADSTLTESMIAGAERASPQFARELAQSHKNAQRAIDEMVTAYGR